MHYDPLYYMIVIPFLIITIFASFKVKSTFAYWSTIVPSSRMNGAEAAKAVLRGSGITDVKVEITEGILTDHYDPTSKTLRLSPQVYNGKSLASLGVAAHEAGHAIQHQHAYFFLALRSMTGPAASIGSQLGMLLFIAGFILHLSGLVLTGIILFSFVVLFQIITLPVEFNASTRAKERLLALGIIGHGQELEGVSKVLNAAAMTYVATTLMAMAQLFYLLLRSGILGGRRNN